MLISLTTYKSWLSSCTSSPVQLACMLESLNIQDLKLRTKTTTARISTVKLPKFLSTFMPHQRIINTWLERSWNLGKACLIMHSKSLRRSKFLKVGNLYQKVVNQLKMEKNLLLRAMAHQRMNWWTCSSTFMFLRLSENLKCTSIECLVLVLTWQSHLSIILASLKRLLTNQSLTTIPSWSLFWN